MLNNVKIGPKLIGGFLIVSFITLAIGLLGINNMSRINSMLNMLYDKHLVGISHAKEANVYLINIGRAVRNMVLAKTLEERAGHARNIEKYDTILRAELDSTAMTIMTNEGKAVVEQVKKAYDAYYKQTVDLLAIINKQEVLKLDKSITDGLANTREQADIVDQAMTELAIMKEKLGKEMYDESDVIYANMRNLLIICVIIATFIGILIGFFLSRSISKPLTTVVESANTIAQQDLTSLGKLANSIAEGDTSQNLAIQARELQVKSEDEIGMLARAFNNIIARLNESGHSMGVMCDTLRNVIAETNNLAKQAVDGKLSTRGNAEVFKGAYKEIIAGLNATLEAVATPIGEASATLEKMANRDMSARMKGDYKGDFSKIKDSVNTAADNLDQALTQVAQATEQVSSASQQISAGSQSLAQGANEQASSLEEVSSSLEEMSSMTKQNADNALQAKALAGEANGNAAEGKAAMARMNEAINKIKDSSDQTAKIVKTIDEIAMQTNLLALNAAVEAARAGEAGRGFAVVAEEVRNLAQRSAEAAKNTANMIEESVKNAEEGVSIAGEVGKSFEAIAGSNAKVDNLIAEIAAASQEQSQGIDQVNNAVAQMDKVTQQNAANSEESASAAEELSSQAEELQNMVAQFTLSTGGQKSAVKPMLHHDLGGHHTARVVSEPLNEPRKKNGNGRSDKNGKALAHAAKALSSRQASPLEDETVLREF